MVVYGTKACNMTLRFQVPKNHVRDLGGSSSSTGFGQVYGE